MPRLLLISDTHLPRRARDLPGEIWAAVASVDLVVHAGDWVSEQLLDDLLERSSRLIGCWGNNDGPGLRARLPELAAETVGGVRLRVVHETGPAAGRERRAELAHPDCDLLVFGHSHIPWDSATPKGMRLLNPGSPTDRRRQPHATYLTCELADGEVADVRLHQLR